MRELARGLQFPEGPVVMPDGSIILVEIRRGTLTRVSAEGKVEIIAQLGGGPNGAALGPGGKIYVCNNGGFSWDVEDKDGNAMPNWELPKSYTSGSIQMVDPETGKFETLYTDCKGVPLNGPNDLVFDKQGGIWFTDLGKGRGRSRDYGVVYYAKSDGSMIKQVIFPLEGPNGIGLSPDGKTLYVAETFTARLWAYQIVAPGELKLPGICLAAPGGHQMFDSLAVDSRGFVCVGTLLNGGITAISPDGRTINHWPTGDPITTNIAFGGQGLKSAYVTLSSTGRLAAFDWAPGGLRLNY